MANTGATSTNSFDSRNDNEDDKSAQAESPTAAPSDAAKSDQRQHTVGSLAVAAGLGIRQSEVEPLQVKLDLRVTEIMTPAACWRK